MTRKQTALSLAESLGATLEGPERYEREDLWTVDFWAPEGKRWVANGEHATQDREESLTACWRSAISTMRQGLEDCDCGDCAHTLAEEAVSVEQTDSGLESIVCSWCRKDATHDTTGAGPNPVPSCDDCCGECLEIGCGARDEVAPEPTPEPIEEETPLVTIHEATCGGSTYNLWVYADGSVRLYSLDGLPLSPHFPSVEELKRWNGGQGFSYKP